MRQEQATMATGSGDMPTRQEQVAEMLMMQDDCKVWGDADGAKQVPGGGGGGEMLTRHRLDMPQNYYFVLIHLHSFATAWKRASQLLLILCIQMLEFYLTFTRCRMVKEECDMCCDKGGFKKMSVTFLQL